MLPLIYQKLSDNVNEKKPLLDELHLTAKPLIDSCDPEIVQKIADSVQEAESNWNDTTDNLKELCSKYQTVKT